MRNKQNKGAITLIFLILMALVITLLMAAIQSRFLLSLRRSQSAADILIATYQAESEANDVMARLVGEYLDDADISYTENVGDMRIEVQGEDLGDTQIVTVTAFRGFAVGKVQAVRRLLSVEEIDSVEIVLMLDCTTSMDDTSGVSGESRLQAQEGAAVNFIEGVSSQEDSDKFKIGIGTFGTTSSWLNYNGVPTSPDSGLSLNQLRQAIENNFGATRAESACGTVGSPSYVEDFTSVGTAFRHAHDSLSLSKTQGVKQIEIVITDGEPNTRVADPACAPGTACLNGSNCIQQARNYLRCTVADRNTFIPQIGQEGVRDPEVDAYAVTVFDNPQQQVVSIFQDYATEGGYFNATEASQLTGILDNILGKILEDRSTISVKRIIPTPQ